MTLAPADNWHEVLPATGPKLVPNRQCSHPVCNRVATDGHHIWRRSFTAGPKDWVTVAGELIANKTWLCVQHHADVNGGIGGHRAWIKWRDGKYWWYIYTPDGESEDNEDVQWRCMGPIVPQPPTGSQTVESFDEPDPEAPIADHICPECGKVHKHRHKKAEGHDAGASELEHLPARKRTRIQVQVPQDDQEDGADVIFTLLEDEGLQRALQTLSFNEKDRNYHTLARGLYFLHQHKHLIEWGE